MMRIGFGAEVLFERAQLRGYASEIRVPECQLLFPVRPFNGPPGCSGVDHKRGSYVAVPSAQIVRDIDNFWEPDHQAGIDGDFRRTNNVAGWD